MSSNLHPMLNVAIKAARAAALDLAYVAAGFTLSLIHI